ncbi:MAG: prephenate dehydratase [Planctomycetota bacterium]|jgi:chorismate mutase/prephenate dehydratase
MAAKKKATKRTTKRRAERNVNSKQLSGLRRKIDQMDAEIVRLLNERAEIVVDVGKLKRGTDQPIYSPDREYAVLQRIAQLNKGPLPKQTLQAIYRELMSGSFMLEKSLQIGFLGPDGTFSHQAAMRKFGASVDYLPLLDIPAIFDEVARKRCDLGVVPIENTLGGGVIDTLDCFTHTHVPICGEILLEIHHCLLANCAAKSIKRIYSRPEIFAQCRDWLSSHFRDMDLIPVTSSAKAAEMASRQKNAAALGSALAGEVHGVGVLFSGIEDNPNNLTRFLVLSRTRAEPTGDDRTAMMFTTRDRSGALADVLSVFKRRRVNLSSIDSRPARRRRQLFYFFVEAEGHIDDDKLARAVGEAKAHCGEMHILGSFPKADGPV